MLVSLMDITERKLAEEALTASTSELKTRNEELMRFNRVATGRELRMIDLKRQINELCSRSGQPPRYVLDFAKVGTPGGSDGDPKSEGTR